MQGTRGTLYFHKLFSLASLGLKDSGIFVDRIVREFLEIGEAVAARWIEMPQGVLLLQMVPGTPDTGAMYLYDRQEQVFYMLGLDGADDNLTVTEFDDLSAEYNLLRYIADPGLVRAVTEPLAPMRPPVSPLNNALLSLTLADIGRLMAGRGLFRCEGDQLKQFTLQCLGSA
jgi:hypothetical protein